MVGSVEEEEEEEEEEEGEGREEGRGISRVRVKSGRERGREKIVVEEGGEIKEPKEVLVESSREMVVVE